MLASPGLGGGRAAEEPIDLLFEILHGARWPTPLLRAGLHLLPWPIALHGKVALVGWGKRVVVARGPFGRRRRRRQRHGRRRRSQQARTAQNGRCRLLPSRPRNCRAGTAPFGPKNPLTKGINIVGATRCRRSSACGCVCANSAQGASPHVSALSHQPDCFRAVITEYFSL